MWKRNSIALCVAALIIMSVFVGAGTYAYYSGEAFIIDFSSSETIEPVISGLNPGETVHIIIKIPNSYVRDVTAWIRLKNIDCSENVVVEPEKDWYGLYGVRNDIDEVITFGLWIDRDGDTGSCSAQDTLVIDEEEGRHMDDVEEAISLGRIPAWSSIVVVSSYHMDEETENWAQSDTMTFDIELTRAEVEPGPSYTMGSSNKKPVADAGSDQGVYVNETVIFDGSGSYDPDGSIMSWSWSFGDGEKASDETASHTYSEPGTYTVTLTVKDWRNAEASDTCIVTVTEETEHTPPTPKPAEFILSDLSITPDEVEPGEEVTITFTVTNVGEEKGTCTVTLSVEGEPITMEVTLEGGKSETVEFKFTPEAEGTYDVEVDGLTGSFTVKSPPTPLRPAEFILGLTVSPSEVPVGEGVTVSVTITNIGEMMGTHTLEIMIDEETPEGPPIETALEGGASTTVTINVIEDPGDHIVKVEGLTDGFTVTAPPGFVLSPGYIAGILILIIVAGTSVYMLYRGGRLPLPKSTPGP